MEKGLTASLLRFGPQLSLRTGDQTRLVVSLRREAAKLQDPRTTQEVEAFLEDFKRQFPHLGSVVTTLDDRQVISWVRFDLEAIYKRLRAEGIPVVLQTFPPQRFHPVPWLADQAIRQFAEEKRIILSDSYSALSQLFKDSKAKEEYYRKPSGGRDDHLNELGYQMVAEILYKTLESSDLLPRQ